MIAGGVAGHGTDGIKEAGALSEPQGIAAARAITGPQTEGIKGAVTEASGCEAGAGQIDGLNSDSCMESVSARADHFST